jgi:hypothetical protein
MVLSSRGCAQQTKTQVDKIFYDRYYYKYNEIGRNAKKIRLSVEEFTLQNTKF